MIEQLDLRGKLNELRSGRDLPVQQQYCEHRYLDFRLRHPMRMVGMLQ
jgi:hypothetical protein